MLDLLLIPVAVVYLLVVGLLFAYGINFFYLTFVTWRRRHNASIMSEMQEWPVVTVQLPIYNELYVAERLVRAAADLDYPRDRLEIQVLDDSTDETRQILTRTVAELSSRGVPITILHRSSREGYKAGALAAGFVEANGEFLAIFDADFLPQPEFLKRALPAFRNPQVAFVQTRWGHLNRGYSFLTFLQSLAIDAHFMVEQFARSQSGYWFNFNGTAGIWRRQAILDAGGWTFETLTEDLDLSYRAFLRGWDAVYLRDIEVPAELPVSFTAYRRQQHRWARGSFECARKLIPQVWGSPISLPKKIEATLHLTGYGVHLLLFTLGLLYPLVLLLSKTYANLISLFGIAALFNATAFAPTVFFMVAQQQLHRRWWKLTPLILFITALGAGMMLNTVRAAIQITAGQIGRFERTPKFGIAGRRQDWKRQRYQLRLDTLVIFELLFAAFNLATTIFAAYQGNWVIAIYAGLYTIGLLFTSVGTIVQSLALAYPQIR